MIASLILKGLRHASNIFQSYTKFLNIEFLENVGFYEQRLLFGKAIQNQNDFI